MKCALIIPSWSPEDIFSSKTAGSQINYWQPLGTLYVASSMLKAGHEVKFLNGAFMNRAEIIKNISDYQPQFVGIYSTTFGWKKAVRTASEIKKALKHPHRQFIANKPSSLLALDKGRMGGVNNNKGRFENYSQMKEVIIVVGGPYPIAMQEKCLEDSADIDAVITGEGELTVVEMLKKLSQEKTLAGVEGVIYRENGRIVKNPPRPLITDLDSIPFPARELLGNSDNYFPPPATYRRKPVAVIITARGCNRRCIFCFQIDKERKYGIRYRSVESVMQEIELCLTQGYREIKFIDDTLTADYDRAMQIAKEIKTRKLDFTWFASACVHQVDKLLLKAFRDAGCWAILFGAESGVQKNLNAIKKGITLEQIRNAVKAAKEVGLKVYTPFIFGIPGETFGEGLKTIEFACKINPDIANFHALTPFPGTELYENIDKYGTISADLTDFTYQGAAFIPHSMTRQEIAMLRQIAFKKFYSRPRFLFNRVLNLRNISDLNAAVQGIKSLFWLWTKQGVFKRQKRVQ